jgi:uncharacterized membrane protein
MTLAPLLAAPMAVQVHAFAAMAAVVLGVVQFAAPKGTVPHRALGWAWAGLMMLVAGSSFWVTGLAGEGRFSWIHGLSVLTLAMVPLAVWAAVRGRVEAHRKAMGWIFVLALLVTGGFTLLPGRVMHRVVFG